LPEQIRKEAEEAYKRFKKNPYHPSLHLKRYIQRDQSSRYASPRITVLSGYNKTARSYGSGSDLMAIIIIS